MSADDSNRDQPNGNGNGNAAGDAEAKAAIIEKHIRAGRVVPAKIREAEALGDRMSPEVLDRELSSWPSMIHPEPSGVEFADPSLLIWSHDRMWAILADDKLTGELREIVDRLARKARQKRRVVDVEMNLLGEDDRNVLVNRNRAEFFRLAAQIFPKRFGAIAEPAAPPSASAPRACPSSHARGAGALEPEQARVRRR